MYEHRVITAFLGAIPKKTQNFASMVAISDPSISITIEKSKGRQGYNRFVAYLTLASEVRH
jgi:hypothetical protein